MDKMANVEEKVLEYIEELQINEINNLYQFFNEQKIIENKFDLNTLLHILSHISNNHYRSQCFFQKIEQIILSVQNEIQKYFSNLEIFHIFEKNKRILLFLFEKEILVNDSKVFTIIKNRFNNYLPYLFPEIKFDNYQDKINFDIKRQNGENDSYICELIRNDNVKDFIIYINQTNYSLNSKIASSIFETNSFFKNNPSLIEYAMFFGSIQIFRYLIMNNVEINPNLSLYAVHSNNAELFHIIEETVGEQIKYYYDKCLIEAIKCHNFNFINYFDDNFTNDQFYLLKSMKYYCFKYICKHSFESIESLKEFYLYYFHPKKIFSKNKDSDNYTVSQNSIFYGCIKYDFIEIAHILIDKYKSDINRLVDIGNCYKTLLHIAVEKENYNIIKLLLSCEEINVNKKNCTVFKMYFYQEDEKTSLHTAIQKRNIEIVNLLLTKNINIGIDAIINGERIKTIELAFASKENDIIGSLLSYANFKQVYRCYIEKRYKEGIIYVANYIAKEISQTISFRLFMYKIRSSEKEFLQSKRLTYNKLNKFLPY